MQLFFFSLFLIYAFSCTAFSQVTSTPLESITLQLQWKHQFEFAGFYAAKEKGFYQEQGLDVTFVEFQKNMDITGEVLKGNAHYGTHYSSLILDYMQGKPIVLLANFYKQSPLVLITQEEIRTPADLKGKTVMGISQSSHNITLLEMLAKFGVRQDDMHHLPNNFILDDFMAKKVDAMSVFLTNEVYTLTQNGIRFNLFDPALYGTKFYDQNLFTTQDELKHHPQRVEKFRKASILGWEYALKHEDEMIDIIFEKYNPQGKSKDALRFEAHQIRLLIMPDIHEIGSIDSGIIQTIGNSFIQSGFGIQKVNTNFDQLIYRPVERYIKLSDGQKNYLQRKKEITMCVDPQWMPLERIEKQKHVGIAADYMQLISRKIDTPIRLIPTSTWSESLHKAIGRACDILALAEKTPWREQYFNFTPPYVQLPIVIATKTGLPFMDDLNAIKERPLGVVKDYSARDLLKEKYPDINLIEVESIHEGLDLVLQEKLFGFLDNSVVLNYEIQKSGLNDLTISGQFQDSFDLSIAVRNDDLMLFNILEEALASVDQKDKNEILSRWINVRFERGTDWLFLAKIVFVALIIILIFTYWNIKLRTEIRIKERVQAQLRESKETLKTLIDIIPVMLDAFDEKGKVTLWNKECEKVFGWSKEEIERCDTPLALFYPDVSLHCDIFNAPNGSDAGLFQEWYPKTKSGETLITKWANVTLPNGNMIHVGYDITQQRKNELAVKEANERLIIAQTALQELNQSLEQRIKEEIEKRTKQQFVMMQQKRLVQMGEMIENIAHQWRQPLSQINSLVLLIDTFLTQTRCKSAEIEAKLSDIESLTAYMSQTIDNFRNFYSSDKQKRTFSLQEAIESTLEIIKASLEIHAIDVTIDVNPEYRCQLYFEELQQVIVVILNNAKDAIVARAVAHPHINIVVHELQEHYVLSISDNGGGIPNEVIEKMFEPYFTTKHKSQGTGLGLYMAKKITEEGLEGHLLAYNIADGACFELHIPKMDEEAINV